MDWPPLYNTPLEAPDTGTIVKVPHASLFPNRKGNCKEWVYDSRVEVSDLSTTTKVLRTTQVRLWRTSQVLISDPYRDPLAPVVPYPTTVVVPY